MLRKHLTAYFITLAFATISNAQVSGTFSGNGNSSFGGTVGSGSLKIDSLVDGSLNFTFTKGSANFDDELVIYIDSKTGGFNSTSSFNDNGDDNRRAISNGSTTLTFNTDFDADYAISLSIGSSFGGIWELQGSGVLNFIDSVNLTPNNSNTSTSYTFDIEASEIGLTTNSGDSFDFFGVYINGTNSFSSDEGFGFSLAGGSPGFDAYSANGNLSFTTIPEPSSIVMLGLTGLAAGGLALLKRRKRA